MVVSGLSSPKPPPEATPEKPEKTDPYAPIIDPDNNKIVTTYAERQLFDFVQAILPEEENIEAKDTQSYFSILFEGKSNRWILHYFDSRQHPSVVFPIELTKEDALIIERSGLELSGNQIIRGCTRLADMLPSKYEDNTLQIKEESTERTAPLFCTRSYRPFCRRYFGYPSQFGSPVLPQNPYGHQPSFGLGCR